jgi:hypothetical protein
MAGADPSTLLSREGPGTTPHLPHSPEEGWGVAYAAGGWWRRAGGLELGEGVTPDPRPSSSGAGAQDHPPPPAGPGGGWGGCWLG